VIFLGDPQPTAGKIDPYNIIFKNNQNSIPPAYFISTLNKVREEKKTYTEKLETAKDYDVFKYLLLIDTAALEGYNAQTRLQAQESFRVSKYVAVVGFVLIAIGIGLGISSNFIGKSAIDAAYLASLAGILTEFISGVFFYLYNRTLQQLNRFHNSMLESKMTITSFLANSLIEDKNKRDDSNAELSKLLITKLTNKE